jgi:hypothetical protein
MVSSLGSERFQFFPQLLGGVGGFSSQLQSNFPQFILELHPIDVLGGSLAGLNAQEIIDGKGVYNCLGASMGGDSEEKKRGKSVLSLS